MSSFEEQMGEQMSHLAGQVIESLAPGSNGAKLVAETQLRGTQLNISIQILDPQTDQPVAEAHPGVTQAVIDLYRLFAENGQGFASVTLTMTEGDDGNWGIDIQIGHEEENAVGDDDAFLDELGGEPGDLGDLEELDAPQNTLEVAGALDEPDLSSMSGGFRSLLAQHAAASLEKSNILEELKAGLEWNVDFGTQVLKFGDSVDCRIDLMGTISETSNTWLWAWANEASGFPDEVVAKSKQVQTTGAKHGIWEFTDAKIDLGRLHQDYLGFVLSGLCGADFHYWARYDGGAALLLASSEEARSELKHDIARVTATLGEVLQHVGEHVDHKKLVTSYLTSKGFRCQASGSQHQASRPDGSALNFGFDEHGRLTQIKSA